jgi:hypothetical protein
LEVEINIWLGVLNSRTICDFAKTLRAALHLEARPIPLEADCMKFQPFLGWRLASTTHYNKIITGINFFPYVKGLKAKNPSPFSKASIIQRILYNRA